MQTTKLSRFWTYSDTYDFGVSLLQRFVGGLKLFIGLFCFLVLIGKYTSRADVLTYHYDKARTGLNSQETILAPGIVNINSFGLLFSCHVDGKVDAGPLYVSGLNIPGFGVRNVLYVATEHDSLYAFDADKGTELWQVTLLKSGEVPSDDHGCNQISPEIGITSTPVIDRSMGTNGAIYLVAMSKDSSGNYYQRMHALDLATGSETLNGPVTISASFPGAGPHSINGNLIFAPGQYAERCGLLLSNGVIYTTWTSHCDAAPYTGWMIAYDEKSLAQVKVININPNGLPASRFLPGGSGSSFWMSGAGPAADSQGNVYAISANGPFDSALNSSGFPANGDYGDSMLKFSTARGLSVADYFTPANQQNDADGDVDFGSGGVLLLPDMTDASGRVRHLAIGAGKDSNLYVVDRDNMGKYSASSNQIYQELDGVLPRGEWATSAYFNGHVYYGPVGGALLSFSFGSARLGTTPSSHSSNTFRYPGTTPSVSSNGNRNGIVWAYDNSNGPAVLHAYDATNVATELYNSTQAANGRDSFGTGNKFITPMVANGKVYAPTTNSVGVFGLFNGGGAVADNTGAGLVDGAIDPNWTIIASPTGASAAYVTNERSYPFPNWLPDSGLSKWISPTANQSLGSAAGAYTYQTHFQTSANSPLTLNLSADDTVTAIRVNGVSIRVPSGTSYTRLTKIAVPASVVGSGLQTLQIDLANFGSKAQPTGLRVEIVNEASVTYGSGFAGADSRLSLNGGALLSGSTLELTDGSGNENRTVFDRQVVNVQQFTNDFTFQLTNAAADGFTFTIQGNSLSILGAQGLGGGLGYAGITKSVAVKFDLYNNNGEGTNSTGLYTNGANPFKPSTDLTGHVDLHSGQVFAVHMEYDGTTLAVTIADTVTGQSFTSDYIVNIPSIVGGNTAYVGFTGGTGGLAATQKILTWTYSEGLPDYAGGFADATLYLNGGASISGSALLLTDGSGKEGRTAYHSSPINVQSFTTAFVFQLTNANADGFTFCIQNSGSSALGAPGGGLAYTGIPKSVAVKFDLHNNAGEGLDSTGLYTAGASPVTPSTDLSSTGVNLHSGDPINVTVSYDGTTLTITETDLTNNATATQKYQVNIPQQVGGDTAYIGFTAGTGTLTATQEILNWSF
jgi:hypothetical protein